MAFSDLLDLRTAVVEELGDKSLLDRFNRFVLLAEAWINRKLRIRDQITTTPITVANGVVALPADFLGPVAVHDASGCELIQRGPDLRQITSKRGYYAVDATELIAADADYTLSYFAALPTLTANTTNWALQKYPELYLLCVKCEAAKATGRQDVYGMAMQERKAAIGDIRRDTFHAQYGDAQMRLPDDAA